MRTSIPTIIMAALVLAGCSSHAGASRPDTSPPMPSGTTTPKAPTPAAIGTTQRNTDADVTTAVTVLHVRTVRSRAQAGEPSRRFLGVDVRVCVVKETEGAVSLTTAPWAVEYADDTEAQPIGEWWDGEFAQPLYPAERRAVTGQCARGWIMFKPLKGKATRVTYAPDGIEPQFWRIP